MMRCKEAWEEEEKEEEKEEKKGGGTLGSIKTKSLNEPTLKDQRDEYNA